MARSYNDGGFWMRPEWFGLIAGQSDENAGKLIKQMIITVENDGNPGEIPAKLAQNRVKIGMAWGTIFPKLREQILGRKNGKKGGNPAFSDNGGSNPPGEPPVITPGYNGGLEPNYNTLQNNTSLTMVGGLDQSIEEPNRKTEPTEQKEIIDFERPSRDEFMEYCRSKGYADSIMNECFDTNTKADWKPIKNGTCQNWKDVADWYWKNTKAVKREAALKEQEEVARDHSFDTDEFLALALKRRFPKTEEPKQENAGDDLPF